MPKYFLFILTLIYLFGINATLGNDLQQKYLSTYKSHQQCIDAYVKVLKLPTSRAMHVEKCFEFFPLSKKWGQGNLELASKSPVSQSEAEQAFTDWQRTQTYDSSRYTITTKGCAVDVQREAEIYDNCIVDKLPVGAAGTLRSSIRKSCKRTACNPGFFDNLKY